jgi:hypothetical protein
MLLLFMSTPRTSSLYPYIHCYHDWQYGCLVLLVSADAASMVWSTTHLSHHQTSDPRCGTS